MATAIKNGSGLMPADFASATAIGVSATAAETLLTKGVMAAAEIKTVAGERELLSGGRCWRRRRR